MTDRLQKANTVEATDSVAPWIDDLIELTSFCEEFRNQEIPPVTEEFRRQCRDTADALWELARLRAEHQRLEARPMPLVSYLWQLAAAAGVSLAEVAARFGIADLAQAQSRNIRALARLSQEIGLSLTETLQLMRIGFAEAAGVTQVASLMMRSSGSPSRKISADCDHELGRIEENYSAQQWKKLERLKADIRDVFTQAGDETA